jgi:hypothetical protein
MNPSNGGIARDTNVGSSWTNVYSKSGISGLLAGFLVTLEDADDDWEVRLIVDGNEIFTASGIIVEDLHDSDKYNYRCDGGEDSSDCWNFHLGLAYQGDDTVRWKPPNSTWMRYESSIEVKVRKLGDKDRFEAGLLVRTNDA